MPLPIQTQDCNAFSVPHKASKDYEDLFLRKRSGHLTEYVYYGDVDYYEQLVREEKHYYPTHSEVALLAKYKDEIGDILGENCNVIEIGPGSEYILKTKVLPLLASCKNLSSYTAVDVNLEYATFAANVVMKNLHTHGCFAHKLDFTKQLQRYSSEKTCFLFLGNTLSNFSDLEIQNLLSSFYNILYDEEYLIIAIDCNEDLKAIRKAYNNMYISKLAFNVMNFFKSSFAVNDFDPKKFQFLYEWSDYNRAVHINLVATEKQEFFFKHKKILIEEGVKYHLIKSRKFKKDFIESMLTRIGFSIINNYAMRTAGMQLCLVQK